MQITDQMMDDVCSAMEGNVRIQHDAILYYSKILLAATQNERAWQDRVAMTNVGVQGLDSIAQSNDLDLGALCKWCLEHIEYSGQGA